MKWIIRGSSSTIKIRRRSFLVEAILFPDRTDNPFFFHRGQDLDEVNAVHWIDNGNDIVEQIA
jgi:hypothetical protein